MKDQNYANHTRFVVGFHLVLGGLLLVGFILSLVNVYLQIVAHDAILTSIIIVILFACAILLFIYTRHFATILQDRAIRAEESMRYYILAHKPLDSRITLAQIIALRFAPDDEFLILADRAVRENLSADEIKGLLKNWRADHHRV